MDGSATMPYMTYSYASRFSACTPAKPRNQSQSVFAKQLAGGLREGRHVRGHAPLRPRRDHRLAVVVVDAEQIPEVSDFVLRDRLVGGHCMAHVGNARGVVHHFVEAVQFHAFHLVQHA